MFFTALDPLVVSLIGGVLSGIFLNYVFRKLALGLPWNMAIGGLSGCLVTQIALSLFDLDGLMVFFSVSILGGAAITGFAGYLVNAVLLKRYHIIELQRNEILVFLSYRRARTAHVTGRIYEHLVDRFKPRTIYKDVNAIPAGTNFKEHIESSLEKTKVFVAIIGKTWVEELGGPDDFVKHEIVTAMVNDIPIIPVLVDNADMPKEDQLPDELKPLIYRNAIKVRPDPDFDVDVGRLIEAIIRLIDNED